MCGEDIIRQMACHESPGSPPHVWGRHNPTDGLPRKPRFTPTCVGKTRDADTEASVDPGSPPHVWGRPRIARDTPCRRSVHPHMCGEDAEQNLENLHSYGSPPHVWGRPMGFLLPSALCRFTPTCVGKTTAPRYAKTGGAVHPHMCGEDAPMIWALMPLAGSPPHVWGRPLVGGVGPAQARFTPTCVGKTGPVCGGLGRAAVHPHMCGEDQSVARKNGKTGGSPPHVWGRPLESAERALGLRFTPTCVGKTGKRLPGVLRMSVHPHTCGEDVRLGHFRPRSCGSPPHVWGRRGHSFAQCAWTRFTPTRVGKTAAYADAAGTRAVHPHTCGEDSPRSRKSEYVSGSPPHVWGRLTLKKAGFAPGRFTPTRVGKTFAPGDNQRWQTVHPHTCGEDISKKMLEGVKYGSPPHVWGRRWGPDFLRERVRFTPTRVGKTPKERKRR